VLNCFVASVLSDWPMVLGVETQIACTVEILEFTGIIPEFVRQYEE
jgi:hypothetical protein